MSRSTTLIMRSMRLNPPILFVKNADSSLHLVIDYQKLNALMIKNCHPLPVISEPMDRSKNVKYYTKPDLHVALNQL